MMVLEDLGDYATRGCLALYASATSTRFRAQPLCDREVSNLLLKALFLEAKSEPIIVGKFLEEFLFVGEQNV